MDPQTGSMQSGAKRSPVNSANQLRGVPPKKTKQRTIKFKCSSPTRWTRWAFPKATGTGIECCVMVWGNANAKVRGLVGLQLEEKPEQGTVPQAVRRRLGRGWMITSSAARMSTCGKQALADDKIRHHALTCRLAYHGQGVVNSRARRKVAVVV